MIRRERDATLINRISNRPEVRRLLGCYRPGEELDWTPVARWGVVLSNGEDACLALEQTETERDWQCTTIFDVTCRGKRAIETGRAFRDYMIPKFADAIFGSIPAGFRHAMWFYRQMGAERADSVKLGNGAIYRPKPDETLFVFRSAS